jgi:hypothetical protein
MEYCVTCTLDEALDRLLHDGDVRERFFSGEAVFSLDEEDTHALATIQRTQLEAMAALICDQVWRTSHRGVGSLADMFPETTALWKREHPSDVECGQMVRDFVASKEFVRHRSVGCVAGGWSLEQTFYEWIRRVLAGNAHVFEHEYLSAMARALTVCPDPSFEVPEVFRKVKSGWCAVSLGDVPVLYAAVGGRLMTGAVTPLVAALLCGKPPDATHEHVAAELRTMGLLE